MPSNKQMLVNAAIIEKKKRHKKARLEAEKNNEAQKEQKNDDLGQEEEVLLCFKCVELGHKDARSRLCPQNKNYKPESTAAKRKREMSSTGPTQKKRQIADPIFKVPMSVPISSSSSVASDDSSTASASTTHSIRNKFGSSLTVAQKEADKWQRLEGKIERAKASAITAVTNPCPTCVQANCYNFNNPHSSSRSKNCPHHNLTIDEYIKQEVGRNSHRFVRKIGFESIVKMKPRAKQVFKKIILESVELYRTTSIKSQLFVA